MSEADGGSPRARNCSNDFKLDKIPNWNIIVVSTEIRTGDARFDPWVIRRHIEYERREKRYGKKHPKELVAVLDKLDTYVKTLNNGVKPLQIRFGFTHEEPLGVVAIDQKGGWAASRPDPAVRLPRPCGEGIASPYARRQGDAERRHSTLQVICHRVTRKGGARPWQRERRTIAFRRWCTKRPAMKDSPPHTNGDWLNEE